jgi:hypothetical protein
MDNFVVSKYLAKLSLSKLKRRIQAPMKPRQRQAAILEHLQKQGKCSVEELAHTSTPPAPPTARIW